VEGVRVAGLEAERLGQSFDPVLEEPVSIISCVYGGGRLCTLNGLKDCSWSCESPSGRSTGTLCDLSMN
jgi:hypothetical protein